MAILTAAGPHVFHWPGADHAETDPEVIALALVEIGAAGIIPMYGLDAGPWCARHRGLLESAGLQVTLGLGMDGEHHLDEYVEAISSGIEQIGRVMLNWENQHKWETLTGFRLAHAIVEGVFAKRSDASDFVTDAPWWAPLTLPDGTRTHPNAPTKEFGRLCGHERYAQSYGAARRKHGETPKKVEGRSQRYLQWAQHQYASMGSWSIRPAYQMYQRTKRDHVNALLADPIQCVWDLAEIDTTCKSAMIDVKRLRKLGYDGPQAVETFQRAHGLEVDGKLGPKTSAALASLFDPSDAAG
jgi:hypothetical protein